MKCILVLIGLVCLLACGCGPRDSTAEPWFTGDSNGFMANNLKQAQDIVPFTIILPKILPGNVKPEDMFIMGPLTPNNPNQYIIQINYRTPDDHQFQIEERDNCPPTTFKVQGKKLEMNGVTVWEFENDTIASNGVSNWPISGYMYNWSRGDIGYTVKFGSYDHDTCLSVVKSMIR
jgi:hypothetical protein